MLGETNRHPADSIAQGCACLEQPVAPWSAVTASWKLARPVGISNPLPRVREALTPHALLEPPVLLAPTKPLKGAVNRSVVARADAMGGRASSPTMSRRRPTPE